MAHPTPEEAAARRLLIDGGNVNDFATLKVNPDELDGVIADRGIGVTYRPALICPCQRAETRMASVGCAVCAGLGYIHPERMKQRIVVLVLNRSPRRNLIPMGEVVSGTAWATFPTGIIPSRGDILIPDNEVHAVNQVLIRAENPVDHRENLARGQTGHGRAPVKPRPMPERLLYRDVREILGLYWLDGDRAAMATEGAHYTVSDGLVTWKPGAGPRPGAAYSIRYHAQAEYMVAQDGEPMFRSDGEEIYPFRVQVQRLDNWGEPNYRTVRGGVS